MSRAEVDELRAVLLEYIKTFPAFRMKPIGGPGSRARAEQNEHIAIEDRARTAIARSGPTLPIEGG